MKSILFSLFILFSNVSHAGNLTCQNLFAGSIWVYDDALPAVTNQETSLREEVRRRKILIDKVVFKAEGSSDLYELINDGQLNSPSHKKGITRLEELRLKDAIEVANRFYQAAVSINSVEENGFRFYRDFTYDSRLRLLEIEAGLMMRLDDLLSAKGIEHSFMFNQMYISASDKGHYINKFAKRLLDEREVDIAIGGLELVEKNIGAYYGTKKIVLPPSILLERSLYQNGISQHEYTHMLDFTNGAEDNSLSYLGLIGKENISAVSKTDLGIYKDGFYIDEIRAFKASIRYDAHVALTTKSKAQFDTSFEHIASLVKMEIGFSESTMLKYAEAKDETYEMAKFTLDLFKLLDKKLANSKRMKFKAKRELVKSIVKVLSIPEVRKLNGNYPSIEAIEEILN